MPFLHGRTICEGAEMNDRVLEPRVWEPLFVRILNVCNIEFMIVVNHDVIAGV